VSKNQNLMNWTLNETVETQAGSVVAGSVGCGPPMVLAHGWPWSSYSWHRVIPLLAGRFKLYWYDMPGYGQSNMRAEQRTSLDIQGQVFTEMISHWGLRNPAVVAHDFGGATTLRAHLLHGSEYSQYILMNVVAMRPWGSEFFDHVGRHVDAFVGFEDLKNLIKPWLSEEGKDSFYRQFSQADEKYTAEIESLFEETRCPVKIMWGEDDPWIPLERGRALHTCMPDAGFQTFPGVGHLPQLEAPVLVAKGILDFMEIQSG